MTARRDPGKARGRGRATEAPQAPAKKYQDLFESSPVGIYESTQDGKIEVANTAFARMLGYSRAEDLLGLDMAADIYAEASERAVLIEKLGSLEEKTDVEVQLRKKDGSRLWVQLDVRAIRDASTRPLRFQGFVRDIQQRREAEEALRRSEERFRSLIEASRDAIAVMDPEGTLKYASPSAENLSGHRPQELVGRNAFSLVHPEDLPRLKARLAEISVREPAERPIPMSFRLRHRDGRWRFLELVASNHMGDPALGGFVLSLRDVTDRKEAEESLRKLMLAVEQAGSVILMTDPDGNISYVNPAFEKVYGFSRQEAIGRNPRFLKSGRHDKKFYEEFWRKLLAGEPFAGEIVNKRRDGQLVTLETTVTPVSDKDARRVGYIAVQDDVTEKRRLEDQLRQSQKMEAIGELAGGIAHDFNNLLTAILGYSDLLALQSDEGEPIGESLSEIRKAGERAASLTRQLLAFSRRQVLDPKVLAVNDLIENLQKMLSRLIGEDVDLRVVLQPDLGRVRADAGQLEQVIMNLAVNARDAMPQGGSLTIETADVELDEVYAEHHASVEPGPYVMFSVSDTGVGMDAATRAHLFEPFFTTKEKGKGTGLGLATVYGIVKQSGGSIWAYSEPGQGATFKVYLPRVDEALPSAELVSEATLAQRGSETILLSEDDESVRELTRRILESRGYRVLEASNGAEALAAAGRCDGPIHLLLTDLIMPDLTGAELAKRLLASHPDLRILYMSGYTDDQVVRNGLLEQGHAFLQKPFTPDALARKVRAALTPG